MIFDSAAEAMKAIEVARGDSEIVFYGAKELYAFTMGTESSITLCRKANSRIQSSKI